MRLACWAHVAFASVTMLHVLFYLKAKKLMKSVVVIMYASIVSSPQFMNVLSVVGILFHSWKQKTGLNEWFVIWNMNLFKFIYENNLLYFFLSVYFLVVLNAKRTRKMISFLWINFSRYIFLYLDKVWTRF